MITRAELPAIPIASVNVFVKLQALPGLEFDIIVDANFSLQRFGIVAVSALGRTSVFLLSTGRPISLMGTLRGMLVTSNGMWPQ
jgi:hypothetical protein